MEFPDTTVVDFRYKVIQPNRLSWRAFIENPNPAAMALMVKMKIEPQDRTKVKIACARLIAKMQLEPDKAGVIWSFIEKYLPLTAEETQLYEREFAELTPEEQGATMELITSWERKGLHAGQERIVMRQIKKRYGAITPEIETRLESLTADQLDQLSEDFLDFTSITDLENWLARHQPNGHDATPPALSA